MMAEPGRKSLVWQANKAIPSTGVYTAKITVGGITKSQRLSIGKSKRFPHP